MKQDVTRFRVIMLGAILALLGARPADATRIQELVRIKGHERNTLTGMGIVIGLNGTGDTSKDSLLAARPYAKLLENLGNPLESVDELARADAFAIVQVTMDVPATGVREGDRLVVHVNTMYNATNLEGGRLIPSILRLPIAGAMNTPAYAMASGPIVLEGPNPRGGVIRDGGQMIQDIRANPVTAAGTMALVLRDQYAGFPTAAMIANSINDEFSIDGSQIVASVEDAKNIKILLPRADRDDPADFIAALMTISIAPSLIQTEARVVINQKEGIIVVTGDVEIGPVGITHKDMTITTITPPQAPTPLDPLIETHRWAPLDTTGGQSRRSTQLNDVLAAFKQLNVPVEDQIAIIYELKKTGALHAEIVSE